MDHWIAQAEMESEWNARWDYIAELRVEHDDSAALAEEAVAYDRYYAALDAGKSEAEAEAAFWGAA